MHQVYVEILTDHLSKVKCKNHVFYILVMLVFLLIYPAHKAAQNTSSQFEIKTQKNVYWQLYIELHPCQYSSH